MTALDERHGHPRVSLAHTPTPLELLPRLSETLGGPEIWVKRDDCTGLAMGGNKARQLEYYMGAALAEGADTVLITSAVQSNFMRMAAAAAAKLGLSALLQSEPRVSDVTRSYKASGNVLLDHLFGADVRPIDQEGVDDERLMDSVLDAHAERLRADGAHPFVIHLGAEYPPLGALGYVDAGQEIDSQARALDLSFDAAFVASGSALTHVGLLAGLRISKRDNKVIGVCVRRPREPQMERVWQRSQRLAGMLGRQGLITQSEVECVDEALGEGYGKMSGGTWEAIRLAARTEGLLLDPVYTGKVLAAVINMIRDGRLTQGQRVLLVHTGGTPALFGYEEELYRRL